MALHSNPGGVFENVSFVSNATSCNQIPRGMGSSFGSAFVAIGSTCCGGTYADYVCSEDYSQTCLNPSAYQGNAIVQNGMSCDAVWRRL